MIEPMKILWWIIALAPALLVACSDNLGSEDSSGDTDRSEFEEETPFDPDGDYESDSPCGYGSGYGSDCPPEGDGLDCAKQPCLFGTCEEGRSSGYCECWTGYDGKYCDRCAEGFLVRGLRCIRDDPCAVIDCHAGECRVINDQPVCECGDGYSGTLCNECAEGYHVSGMKCLPDEDE